MIRVVTILLLTIFIACQSAEETTEQETVKHEKETAMEDSDTLRYDKEKHLRNVRQLTNGGENAEAYFSYDNNSIVFQRTHHPSGVNCDQIYWSEIPANGGLDFNLVSTGKGRTTCAFFMPGNEEVVYASTHLRWDDCPPVPDREKIKKYVWPIYNSYEIFIANKEGIIQQQLTDNNYYDAEATVSPTGQHMVFTSNRTGDLELYVMDLSTQEITQVTDELGYDGGAFFSPDGTKLVYRSSRPKTEEAIKEYKDLLKEGLVAPSDMEIYVANIDGTGIQQVTQLGHANWAPYFHPSGQQILFSSNHKTGGFQFNLFMINLDGTGLEQITFDDTFDAFPMFSFDGKKLLFSSNRNNGNTRDTNIFIADWVE